MATLKGLCKATFANFLTGNSWQSPGIEPKTAARVAGLGSATELHHDHQDKE